MRGDYHLHTTFCDGKCTPEEMIRAAISRGYESVGLSGHSYVRFDGGFGMTAPEAYRAEVRALKEKYRGTIDVFLGIEQDALSERAKGYDYIIGSAHTIMCGDGYITVDYTPEYVAEGVRKYFGGDWLKYTRAYYELAAEIPQRTGADIIGHFDLVAKFNEGGRFFDEESFEYKAVVYEAIKGAAAGCRIFEINSGAVNSGYRSRVYPAVFILKALRELGCRIILSSDAHDAGSVGFIFGEMAELARECGFKSAVYLKPGGFGEYSLI
ncbi:MAG TPA: histidinol-phosphatase HisJ family protein [Clostridiales bacterium]|jgi:histidinol-phosphatase (PHP family)|nr:histidinol-phosphatase HisJ family protein [Clostridiales bacterium]